MPAGVAGVIAAGALAAFLRSAPPPDIPTPPSSERMPAAMQAHLRDAYAAARRPPHSPGTIGAYCIALHADMLYAAASRCYDAILDLTSGWEWIYFRSLLAGDLSDMESVLADLRRVTAAAPRFAPAWLRLGDAEFKAGRYDDAERAWQKVTELPEPERPQTPATRVVDVPAAAHASLGLARIRMIRGDTDGARRIVEPLAAGPPFSSAHRLLAEINMADGRDAEAHLALARARRLPPFAPYADPFVDRLAMESRNSTLLIRLASEANLGVNGPWSEYLTRRALDVDPGNPEVVIKLGRVLRTLGKNDEALHYFRRYEEMVPGDPQILGHLGSCLSALGRYDEAEPFLRRAVAALDDTLSHYNLALLLARTGRLDDSLVEYRLALERDPNDVNARTNLAGVLARTGQLRNAVGELQQVLRVDPENAVAYTNLGLILAQMGDVTRAREALQQAVRLDPALTPAAEALRALSGS